MILYEKNGHSYEITDPPFKIGGEATLHAVTGYPEWVAKCYKPEKCTRERENKVTVMSKLQVTRYFKDSVVFPLIPLYQDDSCHAFAGYLMERVRNITELQEIYFGDDLNQKQKTIIAMNLCVMTNLVHSAGQVIGDYNPKNIALDKATGIGKLIDTDSFHITVKSNKNGSVRTFPCKVGVEALIAPELRKKLSDQHADLETVQGGSFTKETDLYALGFHIFALLMGGATPYRNCVDMAALGDSKNVSSVNIDQFEAAKKGDFLFAKQVFGKKLPEDVPDFNILSPALQELFKRCFIDGAKKPECRPQAAEYYSALSTYYAKLKKCSCGQEHYLWEGYHKPCEWCRIQQFYQNKIGTPV
jgi:DNA-binding helix-hairpin-helix protein with protein kinase domain